MNTHTHTHTTYTHTRTDLWHISILGLLTYLIGVVGVTFYYSATHWDPPADVTEWRWRGLPHFYGVAVYSLEAGDMTACLRVV